MPKQTRIPPETLKRARENRATLTPAEIKVWSALRAKQLDGLKFTKQVAFAPYIADFACCRAKLIVEVDGDSHAFTEAADARRTAFLDRLGYRVIRFANSAVYDSLEHVLRDISEAAHSRLAAGASRTLPIEGGEYKARSPPSQGGGEKRLAFHGRVAKAQPSPSDPAHGGLPSQPT
ncbi:MAG: endonuclease domain-containing protein [Pacificimonas sp.]